MMTYIEHGEHGLTHVEGVPPVVVRHRSVVFLHTARPSAHNLQFKHFPSKLDFSKVNLVNVTVCYIQRYKLL